MQKVVQITFAREDYQITATTSVDEALAKCREQRPDVVLADASPARQDRLRVGRRSPLG